MRMPDPARATRAGRPQQVSAAAARLSPEINEALAGAARSELLELAFRFPVPSGHEIVECRRGGRRKLQRKLPHHALYMPLSR